MIGRATTGYLPRWLCSRFFSMTWLCAACWVGTSLVADEPIVVEQIPVDATGFDPYAQQTSARRFTDRNWCLDILPDGLIYRPYLAGPKESRTSLLFVRKGNESAFDSTVGGQWGLFRIGTRDAFFPKGLQLDLEASAQFRQRSLSSLDILTSDLRFGLPLSYSRNNHQTKLALYFLRSHPSDSLLDQILSLRTEEFFQRKSFVLGHSIYLTNRFRIYGEVGYAFSSDISEQWEFQFGAEYAPVTPTGILGAPFLAANGYLREEVDYGGTFTLQAGWSWRNRRARLLRIGAHYSNGKSNHFALHDWHEQQYGFGIWHDF